MSEVEIVVVFYRYSIKERKRNQYREKEREIVIRGEGDAAMGKRVFESVGGGR